MLNNGKGVVLIKFRLSDRLSRLKPGKLGDALADWFPEREFFMRSQGQVRFIRISSRLQIRAVAAVAALLLLWLGTLLAITVSRLVGDPDRLSLLHREATVLTAENRVARYRNDVARVADDVRRRQDVLDRLVQAHLGALPAEPATPAAAPGKVSVLVPEAAGLANAEARQLAFVDRLTRYAERRAAADAARLRDLGLEPDAMAARGDVRGEGGPLLPLARAADGPLAARFARLGASLQRMSALAQGLGRLPQVLPARLGGISSGFGYRSDPFTHSGAFHPGLDFLGPTGAPIFAAANGRVSFVGQMSGYGNCVEINHGNGLVTRYGHMSAFRTQVGAMVRAGDPIGAIGSTGRSTGPHLHFEVRIDNRPVNPRPFLEASNKHVFEKAASGQLDSATVHD